MTFNGTKEEGMKIYKNGNQIPDTRIANVGKQSLGHGIFMQGSQIFHQVAPLIHGNERTTLVISFEPKHLITKAQSCNFLSKTYNQIDPFLLLLPDWVRFRSWRALIRFQLYFKDIETINSNNKNSIIDSNIVIMDENEKKYILTLNNIVNKCIIRMKNSIQTLPFTSNSTILREKVENTIMELRVFLLNHHDYKYDDRNYIKGLKDLIEEIDNCVKDICTLSSDETSEMVYF